MVSFDEVERLIMASKQEVGPEKSDIAFCAVKMAEEYAASQDRDATIEDVKLALTSLCWFPPGKPPQSPEIRQKIIRICALSHKSGESFFVLSTEHKSTKGMDWLLLDLKRNMINRTGLDLSDVPLHMHKVSGKRISVVNFGDVINKFSTK